MSLITRTLSALGFEKRAVNGDAYWESFAALRTGAVTPQAAETLSTVSACVSAISETIASLPLHLYKRTESGRERATDHSLARTLHDAPNERQSALEFREMMTANMLLRGNAYAKIIRGSDGQVKQLIPIHPDRVNVRVSCPPIRRSSVVLPQPLPPMMATTLPRGIDREMSRRIVRSP